MNDSQQNRQADVDVLVVGAGPTGLTLACDLARRGLRVRIVEKKAEPFAGSRAKGLQPRTLEVFDDLGIIDDVLAAGVAYPRMRIHIGPFAFPWRLHKHARVTSAVRYPNLWMVPQARTEAILRARLEALGGRVEMATELEGFEQDADGIAVRTSRGVCRARYLVGCDGGHSVVRKALGIDFAGPQTKLASAVVGDVHVVGLDRRHWHAWPTAKFGPVALCPLPHTELFQLFHQVDATFDRELTAASVDALLAESIGRKAFTIRDAPWLSLYRPNVRLAAHYRVGRVFLAGDAAHVHPPTGGQGLNAGVQDAYNLGWKLGAVIDGAPDALLDSYEQERRAVAADILGLSTALYRNKWKTRGDAEKQLQTSYRGSTVGEDRDGVAHALRAGDRMPDARFRDADGRSLRVFDVLRGAHPTIFAFGAAACEAGADRELVVVDAGLDLRSACGLDDNSLLLVRPDGYVGFTGRARGLAAYLDRFWPRRECPRLDVRSRAHV